MKRAYELYPKPLLDRVKEYRKDNFEQALMYYERALSCFRWLEYKEDPEEDSDAEENKDKENNENKDKK